PPAKPARAAKAEKEKMKRKNITLKYKLEIINRIERGEKQKDIIASTGLAGSTIYTIFQNKEKIKRSAETLLGGDKLSKVSRSRHAILERMELLLLQWIEDQNLNCIPLSTMQIQEKALSLFEGLKKKMLEEGDETVKEVEFAASRGWFDRFRQRVFLHTLRLSGETPSADAESVTIFPDQLLEGGYDARQVFNMDETGLFWKRMPSRTFISQREKRVPGPKPSKDRLTLLLGGNLNGDIKLKPLLVYHSENPRAMRGMLKSALPVIWRSNRKAWVTQDVFMDYIRSYFSPFVEKYCRENNLPNKALLVIDNAPGHPAGTIHYADNVEVVFLPQRTTSLLQPMDQGIIATFKAYYLENLMRHLVSESESGKSLLDVWKDFNIKVALRFIAEAWDRIKPETMNAVWSKLCPSHSRGLPGLKPEELQSKIQKEIVKLAEEAGFKDVDEEDVAEVLTSHNEELRTEELVELEKARKSEEDKEELEEVTEVKEIDVEMLREIFNLEKQLNDKIANYDDDIERSIHIRKLIKQTLNPYHVLYEKKLQHLQQSSMLRYFQSGKRERKVEEENARKESTKKIRKLSEASSDTAHSGTPEPSTSDSKT
uniref:HTH CENPB-type domain-containing protein n=1 Tax=Scleropages formosus TaxID=113540 RepID=A0A8C9VTT6_SCLFO